VSGKSEVETADVSVSEIEMVLTLALDCPESERAVLIPQKSWGIEQLIYTSHPTRKLNRICIRMLSLTEDTLLVKLEPNQYFVFTSSICLTSKQR
jgi:hypothetical protein